jgi:gluconate transporter
MPLLIVLLSVLILLGLILLKFPPLIALIMVSISAGLMQGMPVQDVFHSIESGIGSTLGTMALVLGLGAMFGKLVEESGAAQRITQAIVTQFGIKHIQWAVMLTGLLVGIPLFYNAGFVILVPLIFSIAASARLPLLFVGIPMAASLSVTHGFLPPHPGPTAIAAVFHADIGKTLLYGFAVSIPAIILAGPVFSKTLRKINVNVPREFIASKQLSEEEMPSAALSITIALLPVAMIAASSLLSSWIEPKTGILKFFGEPMVALLFAVLIASYFLAIRRGRKITEVAALLTQSIGGIAMIMLIIAGGGAFKQVLVDGGVSTYITSISSGLFLSPLFLGWLIAAVLRVSVGSATVAALTAAGIVAPLTTQPGVSPELMVLAVGAGSLMFSHVNDTGFWMFKEYFNLTLGQTFRSWSLMETVVSVTGLIGVLVLNSFI